MQASGARGSIGKASYEAVRKHIDAGKKATEAFKLVAQETGRSTATVQTAYYRVARSLPGGGGVQLRPRKKSAAKRAAAKTVTATAAAKPAARRGRPPKSAAAAAPTSAAAIARQLSEAAEALVAHIVRLERSSPTRARTASGWTRSSAHSADARAAAPGGRGAHEDLDRPLGTRPPGGLPPARAAAARGRTRRRGHRARLRPDAGARGDRGHRRPARRRTRRALRRRQAAQPGRPLDGALALGAHPPALRPRRGARLERPADRRALAARPGRRPLRLRVGDVPAHDRLPARAAGDRARRDPAGATAPLRRRAAEAAPLPGAQGGVLPPRLRARPGDPRAGRRRPGAHRRRAAHAADRGALPPRPQPGLRRSARPPRARPRTSTRSSCRGCASRPTSCAAWRCRP